MRREKFTGGAGVTRWLRQLLGRSDGPRTRKQRRSARPQLEPLESRWNPVVIAGPDTFGYRAQDTAFTALDLIPGDPGVITVLDNADDGSAAIDLGTNTFNFYGVSFTGANLLFAGSNGLVSFVRGTNTDVNGDLTGLSPPNVVTSAWRTIAPLWDDWRTDVDLNDQILARFDDLGGGPEPERLVIEWNEVGHFIDAVTTSTPVTFQVFLQLNTGSTPGTITYNYVDLDAGNPAFNNGQSATIGVKSEDWQGSITNRMVVSINALSTFVGTGTAILVDTTTPSTLPADRNGYRVQDVAFEALDLVPGGAGVVTVLDNLLDGTAAIPLGTNTFTFYGTTYTGAAQLFAHVKGLVVFGSGATINSFLNNDLSNAASAGVTATPYPAQAAIAPLWDNWTTNADATDQVLYRFDNIGGDPSDDRLVIEWNEVAHNGGFFAGDVFVSPGRATFQVILQLNTPGTPGAITFNYPDLVVDDPNFDNGASATVGIKVAGQSVPISRRVLVSHSARNALIGNGEAVRINQHDRLSQIVDNDDAGYSTTGAWTNYSGPEPLRHDLDFLPAGIGSNIASWTFTNLTSGSYSVSATWFGLGAGSIAATDATYQILNGATVVATVSRNQEAAPDDLFDAGLGWENLGTVAITTGTLTVRLTDLANDFVQADGIRIEQVGGTFRTVDGGDPGFVANGTWSSYVGPEVFGSDELFIGPGIGSNTATWTFTGLAPGLYRASTTWFGLGVGSIAATNARYSIFDGFTNLEIRIVNQEIAPNDFNDAGTNWEDLGFYTITSGTLSILVTDQANDFVQVDAVRLERIL